MGFLLKLFLIKKLPIKTLVKITPCHFDVNVLHCSFNWIEFYSLNLWLNFGSFQHSDHHAIIICPYDHMTYCMPIWHMPILHMPICPYDICPYNQMTYCMPIWHMPILYMPICPYDICPYN